MQFSRKTAVYECLQHGIMHRLLLIWFTIQKFDDITSQNEVKDIKCSVIKKIFNIFEKSNSKNIDKKPKLLSGHLLKDGIKMADA